MFEEIRALSHEVVIIETRYEKMKCFLRKDISYNQIRDLHQTLHPAIKLLQKHLDTLTIAMMLTEEEYTDIIKVMKETIKEINVVFRMLEDMIIAYYKNIE